MDTHKEGDFEAGLPPPSNPIFLIFVDTSDSNLKSLLLLGISSNPTYLPVRSISELSTNLLPAHASTKYKHPGEGVKRIDKVPYFSTLPVVKFTCLVKMRRILLVVFCQNP